MKDELAYLIYIDESIEDIVNFTRDGRETFMASKLIQAAVLFKLQTLADATSYISETNKIAYAEVDWPAVRGLRNRLAHDYMGTNLITVWNVVENYLPELHKAVKEILQKSASEDSK